MVYRRSSVSSRPKTKIGSLSLAETSRVVGVISSASSFHNLNAFPCDLVEIRLDKIGQPRGWLQRCQQIERAGQPVLLTMRLKNEGGACPIADEARLPIFKKAMALSAVDVELRSKIAAPVARLAAARGKACVLSFHDFQKTPPLPVLQSIMAEAEALGGVTKIATAIRSSADVKTLTALLKAPRKQPLCLIGMGEKWTQLRVDLAQLGSCLTYGYLDTSAAPGQMSAASLSAALRLNPEWRVVNNHHLEREYKFPDFRQALAFTNKIGSLAERQNHHPDIYLAWGKVKLTLWSHSAGGLTSADFRFAAAVDNLG